MNTLVAAVFFLLGCIACTNGAPSTRYRKGSFPVTEDCSRYTFCTGEYCVIRMCPPNHVFHVTETGNGKCIRDKQQYRACALIQDDSATRSAENSHKGSSERQIFSCRVDENTGLPLNGFQEDFDDCTKFYLCVDGIEYGYACPPGLYWSKVTRFCDVIERSTCASIEEGYSIEIVSVHFEQHRHKPPTDSSEFSSGSGDGDLMLLITSSSSSSEESSGSSSSSSSSEEDQSEESSEASGKGSNEINYEGGENVYSAEKEVPTDDDAVDSKSSSEFKSDEKESSNLPVVPPTPRVKITSELKNSNEEEVIDSSSQKKKGNEEDDSIPVVTEKEVSSERKDEMEEAVPMQEAKNEKEEKENNVEEGKSVKEDNGEKNVIQEITKDEGKIVKEENGEKKVIQEITKDEGKIVKKENGEKKVIQEITKSEGKIVKEEIDQKNVLPVIIKDTKAKEGKDAINEEKEGDKVRKTGEEETGKGQGDKDESEGAKESKGSSEETEAEKEESSEDESKEVESEGIKESESLVKPADVKEEAKKD